MNMPNGMVVAGLIFTGLGFACAVALWDAALAERHKSASDTVGGLTTLMYAGCGFAASLVGCVCGLACAAIARRWRKPHYRALLVSIVIVVLIALAASVTVLRIAFTELVVLVLVTLLIIAIAAKLWTAMPGPNRCSCGYDLTGNVSGLCPECGTVVHTKVGTM